MENDNRKREARPIFRTGAGFVSLLCFLMIPIFYLAGDKVGGAPAGVSVVGVFVGDGVGEGVGDGVGEGVGPRLHLAHQRRGRRAQGGRRHHARARLQEHLQEYPLA